VRWGHEVGQGGAWPYTGWNIDDVEIWGIDASTDCVGDVDDDGNVDVDDLFGVLNHWGDDGGPYDVNDDGTVNVDDLFEVLNHWGPCP
jgi:hypothetical protein